jgi:hypothetical protein
MRRLPSILASGAVAVSLLTSAIVVAQVQQGDPAEVVERARQRAIIRAQQQRQLNMPNQMSNQLRPFYRYELMHLRTACGLTREQLREIRPEADSAYQEAIAGVSEARAQEQRSSGGKEPDYIEAIHGAVVRVFWRHLTVAQRATYEEDRRRREAARKEAGVDLLVAVLDRELLLTERQRQQLATSLSAHWDDRWCDALEVVLGQQTCFPKVPDRLVTPYLSATQQETWRRVPRFQGQPWGVAIDHGGDPDMERELGADPNTRNPAVQPKGRPRLAAPGTGR